MDPAVGASVWASGSQVWNGQTGTLIAKAMAKAQKATALTFSTGKPNNWPVSEVHLETRIGRS